MLRILEFITSQFLAFLSNVKDLIEVFVALPRTLLGGQSQSSVPGRLLLILFQIVWLPVYAIGWLLLAPLRVLTDFTEERRHDFMCGIPALLVGSFVVFIVIAVATQAEEIEKRYRKKGELAMLDADFRAAKTYFGRIISGSTTEVENSDLFNWAMVLNRTGETSRAAAVLDNMAPENKVGYGKAHRVKAIMLIQGLAQTKDPEALKKLRWHLENSRDESIEINQAWAVYYMAVNQPEKSVSYLKKAAAENPANLIDIARIQQQLGNETARQRTLEMAESKYRALLEEDPLDTQSRIRLANVMNQRGHMDLAGQVLIEGIKMQPNALMIRSTSDYFVMRHDRARKNNESFEVRLNFLRQAIELNPDHPAIYQRLLGIYERGANAQQLTDVKAAILETLSNGGNSSMAHFALSNVLWMEGLPEQAEWHLEQAYKINPKLVMVINNLAWTLANKEMPELDRAYELAKTAIEASPDDARYRDTYATVLMKQGKNEQAVLEFEKALPRIKNKKPIHEKLSVLYARLGNSSLAEMHASRASL